MLQDKEEKLMDIVVTEVDLQVVKDVCVHAAVNEDGIYFISSSGKIGH